MHLYRKTAVVQLELFSGATEGSLPLATERDFGVILTIEGITYPAQNFRAPINDEQWRQFDRKLRECNVNRDARNYHDAASIRSLAHQLYQSLVAVNSILRDFLGEAGEARRLVVQSTRPELHLLPWGAMIDDTGAFLAAGDLSVVQSWEKFSYMDSTTGNTLRLMSILGTDTNQMTAASLKDLPGEIARVDGSSNWQAGPRAADIDILHLEEHGSAITNEIGDVYAAALADKFANVPIALLWSCCSGAANSWGESPALCLHRNGAGLVLSFLAELHNLDAQSIATAFYRDVFGPAASRDPETALVRIRADKFANEFAFANWASMTVYMRAPIDMSALPLNGPRVPQAQWSAESKTAPDAATCAAAIAGPQEDGTDTALTDAIEEIVAEAERETPATSAETHAASTDPAARITELWATVAGKVSGLQAGTVNDFHGFENLPVEATAQLPLWAFTAWRGNVIRLDGASDPLSDSVVRELDLDVSEIPQSDAAERLVWFFRRIERYGSPLIVWTNAARRHLAFLRTIEPGTTLTFLLIYGPPPAASLIELVNENRLAEAQKMCESLPEECGDDVLSAAYYAFARSEENEEALRYIRRVSSKPEMLLLIANFISRRGVIPNPRPDWMLNHPDGKLTNLQQQHCQEDCFRKVISDPGTEAPLRESGRAKHEFGYLLQSLGKTSVAEMLYTQALTDLEKCPEQRHDYRWHGTLGRLLRDWADLLSRSPERLGKARELLYRAMAIHSFHGRRLQIAYCLDTAARIALTDGRFSEAIQNAMDSANLFEVLENWRGWGEAMKVLFDCLAETRETARMQSLAELALDKLQTSNLPYDQRDRLRRAFTYEKANAHWIAGRLAEARSELGKLGLGPDASHAELDPEFEVDVRRLWRFLALSPSQ